MRLRRPPGVAGIHDGRTCEAGLRLDGPAFPGSGPTGGLALLDRSARRRRRRPAGTLRSRLRAVCSGSFVQMTGDRRRLPSPTSPGGPRPAHARGPRRLCRAPAVDSWPPATEPAHAPFRGLLTLWTASREKRYLDEPGISSICSRGDSSSQPPELCSSISTTSCCRCAGSTGRSSSPAITTNGSGCCAGSGANGRPSVALPTRSTPMRPLWLDSDGLIVDELLVDGCCRPPSRRLWPITEAIKAIIVEARLGRPGPRRAAALAERLVTRLL